MKNILFHIGLPSINVADFFRLGKQSLPRTCNSCSVCDRNLIFQSAYKLKNYKDKISWSHTKWKKNWDNYFEKEVYFAVSFIIVRLGSNILLLLFRCEYILCMYNYIGSGKKNVTVFINHWENCLNLKYLFIFKMYTSQQIICIRRLTKNCDL